jgi:hypothetical protein
MKRHTLAICIVLSLLVFALSLVATQRPAQAQSSTPTPAGDFGLITITGNASDVYGPTQICCEPTAGVSITVSTSGPHGPSGGSALTDASGNYSISNIHLYDTDNVTVTASKTGFPTNSIVRSGIATSTNKVFNFILVPITPTPFFTSTPRPGCGTVVVVTSTPSPTFTPTPRVATATATSCGPIYITATPGGPTATLTRTPTVTPVSTADDTPWPDLTVSSVTYLGSNPACANSPKVQVVVTNIGAFPATGTFSVSLTGSAAQTVNGLAAGQSVTLIFSATGTIATADSTNVITETNESNNSLSGTFGLPTQAHTCTPTGPVVTSTRTPTPGITNTPTRTPTAVIGACSPVTSTITIPFIFDGAGTFCWQGSSLGSFINSWSTTSVSVNGVNVTNMWVGSGSYPAKIGGFYYVSYNSAVTWGHFEAKP